MEFLVQIASGVAYHGIPGFPPQAVSDGQYHWTTEEWRRTVFSPEAQLRGPKENVYKFIVDDTPNAPEYRHVLM